MQMTKEEAQMKIFFKSSLIILAFTLIVILFSINAYANLSDGIIELDLYPQAGDQIYAVGYTNEGVHYWYEIGQPPQRDGSAVNRLALVYYDTISKNFFIMQQASILTIIKINRPFELKF